MIKSGAGSTVYNSVVMINDVQQVGFGNPDVSDIRINESATQMQSMEMES